MDIRQTTEYRLVKQLTSKENRKAVKKAMVGALLLFSTAYAMLYGFMFLILWLGKS